MRGPRPTPEEEDTFGCDKPGCPNWSPDPIKEGWWTLLQSYDGKKMKEFILCRQHAPSQKAGLGVGHIWTNTNCPAYASLDGADCICNA
jgi:hypothetical protein